MLEVFSGRACSGPGRAAADIFAVTLFSLAMCCFETPLDVLDSHAHCPNGALLARVGLTHALLYLEYFLPSTVQQFTLIPLPINIWLLI